MVVCGARQAILGLGGAQHEEEICQEEICKESRQKSCKKMQVWITWAVCYVAVSGLKLCLKQRGRLHLLEVQAVIWCLIYGGHHQSSRQGRSAPNISCHDVIQLMP